MQDNKLTKEELTEILMKLAQEVLILNSDGICLEILTTSTVFHKQPNKEALGKKITDIFPKNVAENYQFYIQRLLQTKNPQTLQYKLFLDDKKFVIEAKLFFGENKIFVMTTDITDKIVFEEKLKKNEIEIQLINEELEDSLRKLKIVEEELRLNYNMIKEKEGNLEEALKISEQRWIGALEGNESLLHQKKLLGCLFDNSPDAIVRFDKNHEIVDINNQFSTLFGYTLDEIKGKKINSIIDPQNKVSRYASYEILKGETILFHDAVRYGKDMSPVNVILRGAPIIINDEVIGGYVIYTDNRQRKKDREKIIHQKKILESLFKYSPDGIAYLDRQGNILNINRRFIEMFGYTLEECKGKNLDELLNNEDYREEAKRLSQWTMELKHVELETFRRRKDGELIPVSIRGGPTVVNDEIVGMHGFYTDITERKNSQDKIEYLSFHDKLTGLYNRAYFEEELQRLDTARQLPISIIVGDVNGLKLTNDVFGHEEGDQLLIKIAEIMNKACRKEDLVARWGGDEFAIILPKTNDKKAQEICHRIEKLCVEAGENPIKISISLGVATKSIEEQSIGEIIKQAEEKMYRNKLLKSKSIRSHIISSLQNSLMTKNHESKEHGKVIKELGSMLAREINLSDDEINDFGLLAILHDIGKIAISDQVLNKPGKLTKEEWEEMKRHSEVGYRVAESSPDLFHIAKYILFHHERWDGTGYPNGLKGEEIPLICRIHSIVEAYHVITNEQVYQRARSHEEALVEISRCAGTQFDPSLVENFLQLMR